MPMAVQADAIEKDSFHFNSQMVQADSPQENFSQKFQDNLMQIENFLNDLDDFGRITGGNYKETVEIPLSDGQIAAVTVENQRVRSNARVTDIWSADSFTDGTYTLTYSVDMPLSGLFQHIIDYTLVKQSTQTLIEITNAYMSAFPPQFTNVSNAYATYETIGEPFPFAKSKGYVTYEISGGIYINWYSQIDMDGFSAENGDITVVSTHHV